MLNPDDQRNMLFAAVAKLKASAEERERGEGLFFDRTTSTLAPATSTHPPHASVFRPISHCRGFALYIPQSLYLLPLSLVVAVPNGFIALKRMKLCSADHHERAESGVGSPGGSDCLLLHDVHNMNASTVRLVGRHPPLCSSLKTIDLSSELCIQSRMPWLLNYHLLTVEGTTTAAVGSNSHNIIRFLCCQLALANVPPEGLSCGRTTAIARSQSIFATGHVLRL